MHKKYLISIPLFAALFSFLPLIDITSSCPLVGNNDDYYLGYCGNLSYGDYEHAAFYLNSEHGIAQNLQKADVLFLGNSKLQITFSAKTINETLKANEINYYLLGFNAEAHEFPLKLMKKYDLKPKVMIINSDAFFYSGSTKEAEEIMGRLDAKISSYLKKWSQNFRENLVCPYVSQRFKSLWCQGNGGILRSRSNGTWNMVAVSNTKTPFIPQEGKVDGGVDIMSENAKKFIAFNNIKPECVIATVVPAPNSTSANGREVAKRLGFHFIAPEIDNLYTMDCCHLDIDSSERWTKEFIKQAMPLIQKCLNN